MIFTKLPIEGAFLIEVQSFRDHRGAFTRAYCKNEFTEQGIDFEVVQSNLSYSENIHTLRGLHYQSGEFAEKKLIKCLYGKILDVIVDVRDDSPTFGQHYKVELSRENGLMLLVPEGIAHGFLTLEPKTHVCYSTSNFYNNDHEHVIRWNDPFFAIQWPVDNPILSDKDANHPNFKKT